MQEKSKGRWKSTSFFANDRKSGYKRRVSSDGRSFSVWSWWSSKWTSRLQTAANNLDVLAYFSWWSIDIQILTCSFLPAAPYFWTQFSYTNLIYKTRKWQEEWGSRLRKGEGWCLSQTSRRSFPGCRSNDEALSPHSLPPNLINYTKFGICDSNPTIITKPNVIAIPLSFTKHLSPTSMKKQQNAKAERFK